MKAVIVIPARYGATRFPGKSLARIQGRPMIQWVWEAARRSRLAEQVVVATDDDRIAEVAAKFGADVVMTNRSHASGTDRMAEVADKIPAQLYVNVQGDEPLLSRDAVDDLIRAMMENPRTPIGTLAHRIEKKDEWLSPEVVKVTCDRHDEALYFSRSPLPFQRKFDAKRAAVAPRRHLRLPRPRAGHVRLAEAERARAGGEPRAAARAGERHRRFRCWRPNIVASAWIRPQI